MQFWGRGGIGVQCMLACGRPPLLQPSIRREEEQGAWGGLDEELGRTGGTGRGAEQGGEPSASLPTLAHPAHCPQCICTDSPPFNPSDNLYFFMQNYLMLRLLCRCNAMHWSPNISTLEVQSTPNTLSTPAFAPQR